MKKIISFLLALLAAVGEECYQTFALGARRGDRDRRPVARLRALALDALPVVVLVALLLARLVAKARAVKFSRGEA